MKILISIFLALLSFACFAFTDSMSCPEEVSLLVKFPNHSLMIISLYALAVYCLCYPISLIQRFIKKHIKIKLPLNELFFISVYGLWYWADLNYDWTRELSRTETYSEHFAIFVAYFFLIYREWLIPYCARLSSSKFMLLFTSITMVLGIIFYSNVRWHGVECEEEYLQIYRSSRIMAIFVWASIAWLFYSRSWKILISSLPFAYLFFSLGQQLSFFTGGRYTFYHLRWTYTDGPLRNIFDRNTASDWNQDEWMLLYIVAGIFVLQLVAYFSLSVVRYIQSKQKSQS